MKTHIDIYQTLKQICNTHSTSGSESELQPVLGSIILDQKSKLKRTANRDNLDNLILSYKGEKPLNITFSAHTDQIGYFIKHVDESGFIYLDQIGGNDIGLLPGRNVTIHTYRGNLVQGITGKKAIHLQSSEEADETPKLHHIWVDAGFTTRAKALSQVSIGDPVIIENSVRALTEDLITGSALDDKACVTALVQAALILNNFTSKQVNNVNFIFSAQEEVGCRGIRTAMHHVKSDYAIALDVTHATDHPQLDPTKEGLIKLGKGPVITRGPNIHLSLFNSIVKLARKHRIPFQIEGSGGPTGTDAAIMQVHGKGVPTALLSLPLRYMHTPVELISETDLKNLIKLIMVIIKEL